MNILSVLFTSAALLAATTVQASDDHAAAPEWTPVQLHQALVDRPVGDPQRGAALNQSQFCVSCHGDNGVAPTNNWPSLAGQKADYVYKSLLDYKSGLRDEDQRADVMVAMAELLSTQDMADLAAFYAAQTPMTASDPMVMESNQTVAETLVRHGDPKRLITPCASCHGVDGQGGINASPALSGQNAVAFERTMRLYRDGERVNDVHQVMRHVARQLSEEEIRWLAAYYEAQ